MEVGFDFRIARRAGATTDPDGISFAWLPVTQYGYGGPGPQVDPEANVAGALGIGFDTFSNGEVNANHISIHYNGTKVAEIATPGLTLANSRLDACARADDAHGRRHARHYQAQRGGGRRDHRSGRRVRRRQELEAGRVLLSAYQGNSLGDQDVDNVAVAMTAAAGAASGADARRDPSPATSRAGGAANRYGFTVTQPTAVVFDALTNNGQLRWQLIGPTDTGGQRSFTQSDSAENGGNPVLLLQPGSYQLVLSANGTNTGSYAFRLAALAEATPLTLGQTQALTLTPGNRTQIYSFAATTGQQLYLDHVSGSNDPFWRLIDPTGRVVFGPDRVGDLENPVLPIDGTYTLLVEGRIGTTAPQALSFRVGAMANAATAMTIGTAVAGSIAAPGDRARYTFTLAADTRLLFDSFTNDNRFNWALTGPSGRIDARDLNRSDAFGRSDAEVIFAPAGDYVLTVDATDDTTGAFGFRLLDLASAAALPINVPTSGSLNPGTAHRALQLHRRRGRPDVLRLPDEHRLRQLAAARPVRPAGVQHQLRHRRRSGHAGEVRHVHAAVRGGASTRPRRSPTSSRRPASPIAPPPTRSARRSQPRSTSRGSRSCSPSRLRARPRCSSTR